MISGVLMSINQAVLFTKPVHHQGIDLDPEVLNELAKQFFETRGFRFMNHRRVTGPELQERNIISQHYLMYSKGALAERIEMCDSGKIRFEEFFGKGWDGEMAAGKILPLQELLSTAKISVHQLFNRWNGLFGAGKTVKLQDGFIMGWLEDLDLYCINAFYPSLESHFYHPDTVMHYYVAEFDAAEVSWKKFRKKILGVTNASNAVPESFRGQLYHEYPVQFPGRDNFIHGSAGPFEAFIERAIHEPDFEMSTNPVGTFLAGKGVALESFAAWKARQTLAGLGELFDQTEEIDTDAVLQILDGVEF
jgi:hypothetical protein